MSEESKKELSVQQTLEVCFIIFEKNCAKEVLEAFQLSVFLGDVEKEKFFKEWYAFVFAGIYHGLSQYAPAYIVLEYVRSIKYFLQEMGYSQEDTIEFLDNQFQVYIKLIIEEKIKECPEIFYNRLMHKDIREIDPRSAVPLSGAMAMLVATCLDIFEKYSYSLNG